MAKALSGERQLVFVTGEPGIGKTTLVEAFLSQVAGEDGVGIARGQCIEHYGAGEAYLPVLEALGRLCRTPDGEHLKALLGHHAPMWLAQMPALLSPSDLEALQRRVMGATHERMLRELAEALEVLTAERTLVLVLEDLHWADVSTLELLSMLARRQEPARVLVIGTYRPMEVLGNGHPLNSMTQELLAHRLSNELTLELLGEGEVAAYLEKHFPWSVLPTRLARVLYESTAGNPLFLVSVVNELVTRGALSEVEERWVLHDNLEDVAVRVPESIQQLVARQRERLRPEEQRVLEAASIVGQEFSVAAIAAALATEVAETGERCARLAERQQFLRPAGIAVWPDGTVAARYGFIHALYQHLWHEQVNAERQQQWHLRVGERKEVAYGEQAKEIAAELAMHFEQGREYRKAVQYLGQAAQNTLRRSANREAVDHLTAALELLKTLPDTPERAQQELTLQIALALPLLITKGSTAPEVGAVHTRALELCQQVGETPQLFPALWSARMFYLNRAELQTARELTERLMPLAQ